MNTWDKIQKEAKKIKSKKDPFWLVGEKQLLALIVAGKLVEEVKKIFGETHDLGEPCSNPICITLKELMEIK